MTGSVLTSGDLVLFDRNNHKSLHQGALVQAGATPIFLPTARNPFGMIGAVDWEAWDEKSLREQIRKNPLVTDKSRADAKRPFRLACIQLATYDGTVYNVKKVLERIGHLCDYVLWDEAWIGYNAFHPLYHDHSPMRLTDLSPDSPGLFSTQSVHKQLAGFSQASQIHKRDEHIRGQRRYVEHKRFNEAFMINASTSPFYPLFASLDVNAKIHEGKAGEMLWDRCIGLSIEARKKFREFGRFYAENGKNADEKWFFDPFVPDVVTIRGSKFTKDATDVPWESLPTDVLKREQQCWDFNPKARWHGYAGYSDDYAMVDPNKLMLVTPGIDRKTGDYLDYRRAGDGGGELFARAARRAREMRPQQHPVPDDAGGGRKQAQHADRAARQIQEPVGSRRAARRGSADAVCGAQRTLCGLHAEARSATRCTTFYRQKNVKELQRRNASGRRASPRWRCCRRRRTRNWSPTRWTTSPLDEIEGRVSATLALIYPPGIGVILPGERWDARAKPMLDYFLAFQESFNQFPGFNYEVQGVYQERENGRIRFYTYVVRE